jgi:hypothetical protein
MDKILEIFNNRELALLIWIAIGIVGAIFFKPVRKFIATAFEIFTSKTFLVIIILLIGYLFLIVYGLSKIDLWNLNLLKDTIIWLIGVGFVIAFNAIGKNIQYFKKIALESIQFTIILEFVVNLHVLSFIFEFTTIPLLVFIGLVQAVNEYKVGNKKVGKFISSIVNLYALTVFIFAIYKTIQNYTLDFTWEALQSLLLPTILTILFIPFSYLIALYSAYENLFIKLINLKNEKINTNKIKWKLFLRTRFNLKKVQELHLKLNPYYLDTAYDIDKFLNKIEKPVANK